MNRPKLNPGLKLNPGRLRAASLLAAGALALGACTVGPNFERPAPPTAGGFLPPAEAALDVANAPDAIFGQGPAARWWTVFGSDELDALVDRALRNSPSLAASNATLARARSELAAARGERLPQVDVNARVDRQQVNLASFGFGGANPEFELYSVGGGVSFDLDLFGGRRRRIEQAAATTEAQLHQTEAAHLTLAGQVVNQVLTIAAVRADIDTTRQLINESERNVALTDRRRRGGEGTLLEVLNAQAELAADRADLPPLLQRLSEAEHMLAILVGETPGTIELPKFAFDQFVLPREVPVALPSALVRQRPDILQAEAELHAANAAIGVATARLYPDITIGATISQGAPQLGNYFSNSFRGYDLFAGLTAPIFHGGTLTAERQAAIEAANASRASYRQTVLEAFGQVADLLQALQHGAQELAEQRNATGVAARSLQLSRRSFEVGNSGVLQVLDSERIYQRALSGLVRARARQYLDVARLYVATAGGWTGVPGEATAAAANGLAQAEPVEAQAAAPANSLARR